MFYLNTNLMPQKIFKTNVTYLLAGKDKLIKQYSLCIWDNEIYLVLAGANASSISSCCSSACFFANPVAVDALAGRLI